MVSRSDKLSTYAIIQTGGKQYRVEPGVTFRVESLPGDEGDLVELEDVLMVSDDGEVKLGNPTLPGAKVTAEVVGNGRGKKVTVFKYKAKTRYRRKNGHRQSYTELRVTDISY
jgi:large subunit ribosomal protein L21